MTSGQAIGSLVLVCMCVTNCISWVSE